MNSLKHQKYAYQVAAQANTLPIHQATEYLVTEITKLLEWIEANGLEYTEEIER